MDLSEKGSYVFCEVILKELAPLIQKQADPKEIFEGLSRFLVEEFQARGSLWIGVDSKRGFFIKGVYGEGLKELKGAPWDPLEEIKASLIMGEMVIFSTLASDPLFSKTKTNGFLVLTPLLMGGELKGVLGALYSEGGLPLEFLEGMMGLIGKIIGPALILSSLWDDLSIDEILERKIEQTLKSIPLKGEGVLKEIISIVEKSLIKCVMEKVKNNQSKASRLLGLNRNTLRKKLKEYNLKP
jgi:DNA-binding protein Fis